MDRRPLQCRHGVEREDRQRDHEDQVALVELDIGGQFELSLVHGHGIAGGINGTGCLATIARGPVEHLRLSSRAARSLERVWIFRVYQRLEAGSGPRKSPVLACLERPLPLSGWAALHASGPGRELGWAQV